MEHGHVPAEAGRKQHIVSFRVSADEYELLRRACAAYGVRNLSDFARLCCLSMEDEAVPEALGLRLKRLECKVTELSLRLEN